MIDTVCLLIPKEKMIVLNLSNYDVPSWGSSTRTGPELAQDASLVRVSRTGHFSISKIC